MEQRQSLHEAAEQYRMWQGSECCWTQVVWIWSWSINKTLCVLESQDKEIEQLWYLVNELYGKIINPNSTNPCREPWRIKEDPCSNTFEYISQRTEDNTSKITNIAFTIKFMLEQL